MKRSTRLLCLAALFLFFLNHSIAQETNVTSQSANTAMQLTATPSHMWEVGVNGGFNIVTGDVDWTPAYGFGVHVRRAMDNIFSLRLDGQYRVLEGLTKFDTRDPDALHTIDLFNLGYPTQAHWYPNYKTTAITGSIQLIMSLNQFRFIKPKRSMNPYAFVGVGFTTFVVKADALDAKGNIYHFTAPPKYSDLDGTYETTLRLTSDNLDKNNFSPITEAGIGIAFKITPRFNIGIEQKISLVLGRASDFLDGATYRSNDDQSTSRDLLLSTFIRLNFNIGNKEKQSEPLWWINPLDFMLNDIAELKARPKLDLTDTDGDGVIDMLDQEKDSPAGAPVDTRGVTLDSDGDGIPNYKDKEPYSPPNYKVNSEGVAMVPKYVSTDDANKIVEEKIKDFKLTRGGSLTDWFLPMIHFDLDKYTVKNSEVEKLRQVATVMENNPSLRILVAGFTDKTAGPEYNQVLSYNRAKAAIEFMVNKYNVPRERLVLNYAGEENALVPSSGATYINRRVEFKVAKPTDSDMARPKGPNAGTGKFEGNRDAGY